MRLTHMLRRLVTGKGDQRRLKEPRRQAAVPGRSGELTVAEDMTLGPIVVEKGTYAVSYRRDGDAQMIVLTALDRAGMTGGVAPAESRRVVRTRQIVARSTVFAEELEDKSLRVKLVQVSAE